LNRDQEIDDFAAMSGSLLIEPPSPGFGLWTTAKDHKYKCGGKPKALSRRGHLPDLKGLLPNTTDAYRDDKYS